MHEQIQSQDVVARRSFRAWFRGDHLKSLECQPEQRIGFIEPALCSQTVRELRLRGGGFQTLLSEDRERLPKVLLGFLLAAQMKQRDRESIVADGRLETLPQASRSDFQRCLIMIESRAILSL